MDVIKDEIEKRDTEDIQKFGGLEASRKTLTPMTRHFEMVKSTLPLVGRFICWRKFTDSASWDYLEEKSRKHVVLALFRSSYHLRVAGNSGVTSCDFDYSCQGLKELDLERLVV